MSNDDKNSATTGAGLPAGWGWTPTDLGAVLTNGGGRVFAEIARGGYWTTFNEAGDVTRSAFDAADAAAARREAEAALWRADGFGTGEVRGLSLPVGYWKTAIDAAGDGHPMELPGLAGEWRPYALTPPKDLGPVVISARRVSAPRAKRPSAVQRAVLDAIAEKRHPAHGLYGAAWRGVQRSIASCKRHGWLSSIDAGGAEAYALTPAGREAARRG